MKGNEDDCICHRPNGKHEQYCDAYRLAEMIKKISAVKMGLTNPLSEEER